MQIAKRREAKRVYLPRPPAETANMLVNIRRETNVKCHSCVDAFACDDKQDDVCTYSTL